MNRFFSLNAIAAILVGGLLLSACGEPQTQPSQPDSGTADAETLATLVSATGVVVPVRYADLSLQASGILAEVLVAPGDVVQAGQPLLRLEGGDPQNPGVEVQAAIHLRQLEVDSAQQALDALDAQAEALATQARQNLTSTASAIRDVQYRLAELELPDDQAALDPLAGYDAALAAYQAAEAAFAPYREETGGTERRDRLDDLDDAKENYDIAVTRLQLYLTLVNAESNRDQARADWEKYRDGPPEEERRLAASRLESAQANLAAALAGLEKLTLSAPFAGTVTRITVRPGEWVSPGLPLVTLADLGELRIETTDLNEIDLVQIAVGDPVQVSFDAFAEQVIDGRVASIASQAAPGSGVNYTVIITMDQAPQGLRWGMSAFVDISPQK